MRVPTADIRKRDFEADIGFDHPRNLLQALTEGAVGIAGAVGRNVGGLLDGLHQANGLESLSAGAVEDLVGAGAVHGLEAYSRPAHLAPGNRSDW